MNINSALLLLEACAQPLWAADRALFSAFLGITIDVLFLYFFPQHVFITLC
jgi:hypothetical protein